MSLHIFDSLEQLLSPDGLARIAGGPIESVERGPLSAEHYSGSVLETIRASRSGQPVRYVLKRFSYERDWIMRRTRDTLVRESALYREGVYARMPGSCLAPVVATARDGGSWANLMEDVSDWLALGGNTPIPLADLEQYLLSLAALHARFLNDDSLADPALGLSTLADFITILSPEGARRDIEAGRGHPVLEWCVLGWEMFVESAPADAVRLVRALQRDVNPLVDAVRRAPHTLVHGDYKIANLGRRSGRTVILDWQDAAFGPPLLDLGYFVAINSARLPVSKDEAARLYRGALAAAGCAYPDANWERDLALGLLAGGAMRLLWQKALGAGSDDPVVRDRERAEVEWWSDQIVNAARWLR